MIPPVDRQTLTRCVLKVELGKPVKPPSSKESQPKGKPIGMRVKESQIKRMLFCNEADTGSNFARHENEQTSDVVLNHVKRFERNNYTGVDR
jgi:hypothetical protein